MPLTRERKEELIEAYTDLVSRSQGLVFASYRGMTNKQMNQVRNAVREANGVFVVTKLSLLQIALERAGYSMPESLDGFPLAVGFALNEVPSVAKALVDTAKDIEALELHGALLDGRLVSPAEVEAIAKLPPLDTLRAQLIGLLDAPASQLVGVLQAGVAQVINVINAYAEQGESAAA
ncbi:MAG TPA: 50S ribosomal protein L10 [Aggregatilineales bacterium]|nr:50S ribosomal protein L10 [Chloroflexota bacterium]HOA23412.1 50S ribosomal protein L10 [Aggregatilineales bacterium]HPV06158.1 50S ribosomal protein L10 [Aggregatilineales bacterium]HQA67652.1 50S ribosomal protein L10 [Aggregatilineales bacterium]HQE19748.1 50S ribosomal protein L10 [Aggregatilineales bacterium]